MSSLGMSNLVGISLFHINFWRAFAYPPLFSVVNPKCTVCVFMLSLPYFLLISPKFKARLIFLSSVYSFKKFCFFLDAFSTLKHLTLQRQTVFACPWVCGQTLQSVVSMSLTCQNIFLTTVFSISFLLCLPKLSMRNQGSPT